jgi:hypothetical protein
MKCDILISGRPNPDYNRLWKIRRDFSCVNNYSPLSHPAENLTVDKVIVRIKGRV